MNRFLGTNLILLMFFVGIINASGFNVGKTFAQNGRFIAADQINLRVGEEFSGNGYIEAPVIEIATKRFNFTGTIHCDGKCTLRVEEPFDETMFKREGSGIFEIIIEPLAPQKQEDTFFAARDTWAEVEQRQKERDDELERILAASEARLAELDRQREDSRQYWADFHEAREKAQKESEARRAERDRLLAESEARRAELDRQGEERRQYWANFHKEQEKAQKEREARRAEIDSQCEETIQQQEEEQVSLETAREKVEEQQETTEPEESDLEQEQFDYYKLSSYAYIAALVISAIVYSY